MLLLHWQRTLSHHCGFQPSTLHTGPSQHFWATPDAAKAVAAHAARALAIDALRGRWPPLAGDVPDGLGKCVAPGDGRPAQRTGSTKDGQP